MTKYSRKLKMQRLSRKLVIFTEGDTERDYLEGLRMKLSLSEEVVYIRNCEGSDPLSVLEELQNEIKLREANGEFDNRAGDLGFVVCDVDEHCYNRPTKQRFNSATQIINSADHIHSVFSNPCFELWLNIHDECVYRQHDRVDAGRTLKSKVGFENFDKRIESKHFEILYPMIDTAVENSEKIIKRTSENSENQEFDYSMNPYSQVQDLIYLINEVAKRNS